MNVCTFIGRVGNDAEVRHTPGGKVVANWPVAVDTGWGDNKTTMWVRCALWGERAGKVAGYIVKGDSIGVSGQISVREYDGKNGKGFSVELNVSEVQLLGGKRDSQERQQEPANKPAPDFDDDLPF